MKKYPSQEYLKSILDYNPETGDLTWKKRPRSSFKTDGIFKSWNTRLSGTKAGTESFNSTGKMYSSVSVNGRKIMTHRIVWVLLYGSIVESLEIDHIDGNGLNNRIKNLRLVTRHENSKNLKLSKSNNSGTVGVGFDKRRGLWRARVSILGIDTHLGYFSNKEDAISARRIADSKYKFHENHGDTRPW